MITADTDLAYCKGWCGNIAREQEKESYVIEVRLMGGSNGLAHYNLNGAISPNMPVP
jgi:hypothetical protein